MRWMGVEKERKRSIIKLGTSGSCWNASDLITIHKIRLFTIKEFLWKVGASRVYFYRQHLHRFSEESQEEIFLCSRKKISGSNQQQKKSESIKKIYKKNIFNLKTKKVNRKILLFCTKYKQMVALECWV